MKNKTAVRILDPHHNRDNPELTEAGDVHSLASADSAPNEDFVRITELVRIVDGDTLRLRIDQGWLTTITDNIRLAGLNAPESRGIERPAGLWVTEQVHHWFAEAGVVPVVIRSEQFSRGKFGRCLCQVWAAGQSLNRWLLDRRYAWPTNENGAIIGPRSLDRLALPESVLREVTHA